MFDVKRGHHLIWTDYDLDYERDCKADLEEVYPDLTESERIDIMYEENDAALRIARMDLDIKLDMPIICIADLGLWYGRRWGYKTIGTGIISECLYSNNGDFCTWYVDELGDFRCDEVHHDGTNNILYRVYMDGTTPEQMRNLEQKIYSGTVTWPDIAGITTKIGPHIAKVYGWNQKGD